MKTLIIIAILFISISGAAAQNKTFFQKIAGNWEGTLEYLDYKDNKPVKLKAYLTVTPAADGSSAEFQTVYDDVTHIVKDQETVKIDAAANKYIDGDIAYQIESLTDGKIVLRGSGQDGEQVQPFRKTISYDENSLIFLKETRSPWQFRNQTVLKRSSENVLAKRILTAAQMKEDFEILKKTLTTIHPGVYRYQSPESLEKVFSAFEAKLNAPLPEGDFFLLVSQVVSQIDCGHTYANPYNQKALLRERLFNQKTYLPFYFRIINGKIIITENAASQELSKGSEITAINGIPSRQIIEKLLTVTDSDGRNTRTRRLQSIELTRFEAERYALFDWYFPLFFPLKAENYSIKAIDFQTKKPLTIETPAMTKDERTAEMAKHYGNPPTYDDGWKFQIQDNSTAYLKIDNSITWRLKTIKFKEFLANAFAELRDKKIKHLIIDLRGNGGGDMEVGAELSKYLATRKLPVYAASRRLVRNVSGQPELAKYLDTYSDELRNNLKNGMPADEYKKAEKDFFEILPSEKLESFPAIVPDKNNFLGQTYIISDASNASATYQFLDYVQENRLAKIAGQETGGNKQGINGGNFYFLYLPNSKAEIDIPMYFQAPLTARKDESIIPDIYIKPNAADVGIGIDTELEYLRHIIGKQ